MEAEASSSSRGAPDFATEVHGHLRFCQRSPQNAQGNAEIRWLATAMGLALRRSRGNACNV